MVRLTYLWIDQSIQNGTNKSSIWKITDGQVVKMEEERGMSLKNEANNYIVIVLFCTKKVNDN